jgi:hypothetical protein
MSTRLILDNEALVEMHGMQYDSGTNVPGPCQL